MSTTKILILAMFGCFAFCYACSNLALVRKYSPDEIGPDSYFTQTKTYVRGWPFAYYSHEVNTVFQKGPPIVTVGKKNFSMTSFAVNNAIMLLAAMTFVLPGTPKLSRNRNMFLILLAIYLCITAFLILLFSEQLYLHEISFGIFANDTMTKFKRLAFTTILFGNWIGIFGVTFLLLSKLKSQQEFPQIASTAV